MVSLKIYDKKWSVFISHEKNQRQNHNLKITNMRYVQMFSRKCSWTFNFHINQALYFMVVSTTHTMQYKGQSDAIHGIYSHAMKMETRSQQKFTVWIGLRGWNTLPPLNSPSNDGGGGLMDNESAVCQNAGHRVSCSEYASTSMIIHVSPAH
jgi:hypothetical protein